MSDLFCCNEVVNKIVYAFPILNGQINSDCTDEEFIKISSELKKFNVTYHIKQLVIEEMKRHIREKIVPKFWNEFRSIETEVDVEKFGFEKFKCAVDNLYSDSIEFLPLLKRLEELTDVNESNYLLYGQKNHLAQFKLILRATLSNQLPLSHETIIELFYKVAFNVFCNTDVSDSNDDGSECRGCSKELDNCECQSIVFMFHDTNRKLIELELLERLVGNVLTSLIHIRIKEHVHRMCDKLFDVSQLNTLDNWLETVVLSWLTRIYSGGSSKTESLTENIREAIFKFKRKLSHYLYETYTKIRIEQLFDIIIEYPDSQPAIDDLRICLERTDLQKALIVNLQNALKTRLLHAGVNTPDILTAYIAAIKALRQLDPTGVLLETVSEPIKSYLRSRSDTVRCVVSGLLDDFPSDLADELVKGESLQLDDGSADEENEDWEKWMPDPVDADPAKSTQRRMSDIISMLVNVYGSQDLFVNEYRTQLADRLLSQLNYHTEREVRHLELLKRRFGENQLHFCEVMLKDIYDSKRIDGLIQSNVNYTTEKPPFATSALILSAQFWPPFKEEWKLQLPKFVQDHLDKYVKAFETLKGNRTLCWKPHLGNVHLEIELKDRKLDLNVAPIHATIIVLFQDKNEWTIEELSEAMHIPATVIRRKITFWVSQGLLKQTSTDVFHLQEESTTKNRSVAEIIEEEEVESAMASASDQREEELQVFWSYIVGMLTNLDSMPLERIHQMLKMFASQGPGAVECGLPELRQFLDKKVREHQLLYSGGLYRLPKI
ncbi:anaphase-promoting complex subunit 2 [Microplitis demolitor]|uniref:anaphase-promoting complex subunit 2 n=1 Tax=Microplitis demolitor TaxID=69319 RepID=UPI0004CD0371|nr:PREDICTED: anaphase-promoting complex subunit 2 isoform X1 [Microplitis demolitor]XP_014299608.2 anaphase-promoting complex subunit 2 [Microplitis demolitor]